MSRTNRILTVVAAAAVLSLAACGKQGPAEKAGEQVDKASEQAGEAMSDAKDKIKDTMEDMKDSAGKMMDKMKEKD